MKNFTSHTMVKSKFTTGDRIVKYIESKDTCFVREVTNIDKDYYTIMGDMKNPSRRLSKSHIEEKYVLYDEIVKKHPELLI